MTPVAMRIWVAALALVAFTLRAVERLWWEPRSDVADSFGASLAVSGLGGIVAIGIPFGTFLALYWRVRPPATFAVRDGVFATPNSPFYTGSLVLVMMSSLGAVVPMFDRDWNADGGVHIVFSGFEMIFALALVAIAGAVLLIPRPWMALGRDGITLQGLRRRTFISWDDLAPGGPLPPTKKNVRYLRLSGRNPIPGTVIPSSEDLPAGGLWVDTRFLADAIRHYVEHPADRALIGTPDGLARLSAEPTTVGGAPGT